MQSVKNFNGGPGADVRAIAAWVIDVYKFNGAIHCLHAETRAIWTMRLVRPVAGVYSISYQEVHLCSWVWVVGKLIPSWEVSGLGSIVVRRLLDS